MTFPDDFFEIDFLDVETSCSGDAIVARIVVNGEQTVSVIDGGYTDCGKKIIDHIEAYYENTLYIDNVILTHPDADHANGLKYVLENFPVARLWMNRPWLYANELISQFSTYNSVDALRSRLRSAYPTIVALEDIAEARGIPILDVFQGHQIGHFTVMAPSRQRFLNLVVESDKTPEPVAESKFTNAVDALFQVLKAAANLVKSVWGNEVFSNEKTSRENEMSVVQFASIGGQKILLTGDAGREALTEVIEFAPMVGLVLPGIDRFQVPHHGSRRNVSTEILDQLLGEKIGLQNEFTQKFTAIISSAKKDEQHPRKAVVRAMIHRGGNVLATEGQDISIRWNAPARDGWGGISGMMYPDEQEA